MPGRRRLPLIVLAAGLALVAVAQLAPAPHATPLFDGIFVEDPYRYVQPPPGAAGDPLPVEVTTPVADGAVPLIAIATGEAPPQAQLIAQADAFSISAAATSIVLLLQPSAPADPQVSGNVYSIRATDQAGAPLELRPDTLVTIILRSPDPNATGRVARFDGTTWVALPTEHGGLPDLFAANITELGEYGVLLTGPATTSSAQPSETAASRSPLPSAGSDTDGGAPNWVVLVLAVAAIGVGLAWGVLGGGEQR